MAQHWMLAWLLCDYLGVRTSIAKEPYSFVIFQGCLDPMSAPSGSAHAKILVK